MMAECGPADRSTVIVTSLGVRSTLARSSPAAPCRATQMPLIATLSRSGSKIASVVPTAARTRPQLGSSPPMAHLSRFPGHGAPDGDRVGLGGGPDDLDRD